MLKLKVMELVFAKLLDFYTTALIQLSTRSASISTMSMFTVRIQLGVEMEMMPYPGTIKPVLSQKSHTNIGPSMLVLY